MEIMKSQQQPSMRDIEVDILVDGSAFLAVLLAVVVGCAIYDIALTLSDRFTAYVKDVAWPDLRERWQDRTRLSERMSRGWGRVVGEPEDDAQEPDTEQFVPDPTLQPERVEFAYGVSSNNVLHRSTCRVVEASSRTFPIYPWPWAENDEEARHYAEVQELRPCGSCRPCGEIEEVDQWWD